MTDTIIGGSATILPNLILGYRSSASSENVSHPILGSDQTDITLRPARKRSGQLSLLFRGTGAESRSAAAETALRAAVTFTLASDDLSSVAMSFVVTDDISRELESQARRSWTVTFGYQEV